MSRQDGEDGYEDEEENLNHGANATNDVVGPTVEQLLAQLTAKRERNAREQQRYQMIEERLNQLAPDPNRPLRDFCQPSVRHINLGYRPPAIVAANFQIPAPWIHLIQQNQFHGIANEDVM